ncbi:SDR family NAD(P)-dependent oxidoreductase [Teredinibacter turnerae]|uniref:SDR family NAD(P)-dependent oxidoreductase n=1 Tax=Teredinibacter turnerae TaxID=2426 RepID=UPI0005F7E601|nr:SDR family NAD(P)-dependent oxidoreductase [Teredinibacter turnerae]
MFEEHFHREVKAKIKSDDYPVAHHLVHGARLLPGVFLIDLIYRAITASGISAESVLLKKIIFREPVSFGLDSAPAQNSRTITVSFEGSLNQVKVRVVSFAEGESPSQAREHLKARIVPAAGQCLFAPNIPAAMPASMDADEVYAFARNVDIVHYEFMKPLGRLSHLDHGTLASVELGELARGAMNNFMLQPVFMDFATLVPFSRNMSAYEQAYIPIYIEQIQVFQPLKDQCRVYNPSENRGPESDDILYNDIYLYNERGEIALIFERFGAKRIRSSDLIHSLLDNTEVAPESVVAPNGEKVTPQTATAKVATGDASASPADIVRKIVLDILASKLKKNPQEIDTKTSFYESGLSSVDLLDFVSQLEAGLELELYPTLLFEHTSVDALHEFLVAEVEEQGVSLVSTVSDTASQHSLSAKAQENATAHETATGDQVVPEVETLNDSESLSGSASRTVGFTEIPKPPQMPGELLGELHGEVPGEVPGESTEIAIVGLAARFSHAENVREFWQNLLDEKDLVEEIPSDRWPIAGFYSERGEPGTSNSKWGSFINGVDQFDPLFFALSPVDAERMDPQERHFMQEAWHALEDAAMAPGSERHEKNMGVFCGVMWSDYQLYGHEALLDKQPALASSWFSSIPNRVSYCFDLHGPSMPVDTACSSALYAIHLACDSLRRGECIAALAGAVNLSVHPSKYIKLSALQMLSPTGRCRAFGDDADGYVPGEGVGAVVLVPLARAVEQGQHVYGIVRGSAIAHGGKTAGFSVPNHESQADAFTAALKDAGLAPAAIDYLEAHGTGTKIGDPIEVNGVKETFKRFGLNASEGQILTGSVKSNLGHLEAAAGIASLAKVLMAMHHGVIPKSLHTDNLNPLIDFTRTPLTPVQMTLPWPSKGTEPRRAAIASFGAGGANAYLIIEQFPNSIGLSGQTMADQQSWVPLSAHSVGQLLASVNTLKRYLSTESELSITGISAVLQRGRKRLAHRLVLEARDCSELHGLLSAIQSEPDLLANAGYYDGKKPLAPTFANTLSSAAFAWLTGDSGSHEIVGAPAGYAKFAPLVPGYPFAKKQFWIEGARGFTSVPASRPDTLANDHQVLQHPVLPGVYYLEQLLHMHTAKTPLAIQQLKWLAPAVFEAGQEEQLKFVPTESGYQINYGELQVCSALIVESTINSTTEQHLKWQSPASSVPVQDVDLFYAQLLKLGIEYGPGLRVLTRIQQSEQQVWVNYAKGPLTASAILDAALQTTSLMLSPAQQDEIRLPFTVANLWIAADVHNASKAFIQNVGHNRFDIGIYDDEENAVAVLLGVQLTTTTKTALAELLSKQNAQPLLKFEPQWLQVPPAQNNHERVGVTLVLCETPFEHAVERTFTDVAKGPVLWAVAGSTFAIEPDNVHCVWNTNSDKDYLALANWLREFNRSSTTFIETVIYVRNGLDNARLGFENLLDLMRAWYRLKQKQPVNTVFLHSESHYSDACAVASLAKTSALEFPAFRLKSLEIDTSLNDISTLKTAWSESHLDSGVHVRYVGGARYEKRMQPCVPAAASVNQLKNFRNGGTYVITGGLGGLGIIFARYLATHYKANLVLVGRRELGTAATTRCDEIADCGGRAIYMSADISENTDVAAVLHKTRESFGELHGWIHSAGVIRDALLPFKTPDQISEVLTPKVTATKALHQALRNQTLDFVLLCSSVSAVLGSKGQADYSAANGFMDGFAEAVSHPAQPWISVNWPLWKDGGMQIAEKDLDVLQAAGLDVLTTDAGMQTFERAVIGSTATVLEMPGDLAKFITRFEQVENQRFPALVATEEHAQIGVAERLELQSNNPASVAKPQKTVVSSEDFMPQLRAILSELLKLDDDDIVDDEPLDSYGIDSVQTVSLLESIEKAFDIAISVIEFSELNTLQKLAAYITDQHPPSTMTEDAETVGEEQTIASLNRTTSDTVLSAPAVEPLIKSKTQATQRIATDVANGSNTDSCPREQDIAIIGLATRFPGAENLAQLWSALQRSLPTTPIAYGDLCAQRGYPFISEIAALPVFSLAQTADRHTSALPYELSVLQALMNELLVSASLEREAYRDKSVGVFLGASSPAWQGSTLDQMLTSSLATQLSRAVGFTGPAMVVDSACSSFMSALYQGCQAIRTGDTDLSVVGAVNLLSNPHIVAAMAEKGMLSADGLTRLFDTDAKGFGLSEGAGLFLLKPHLQALSDGDNVLAVISGISVQNEGISPSQSLPNAKNLQRMMQRTLMQSGVNANAVSYVDISGVGDQLIDVVELETIHTTYVGDAEFDDCVVCSAKAHYGTALPASGMLSLARCILAMHQGCYPPQPNLNTLAPRMPFRDGHFYPTTQPKLWPKTAIPRTAAINNMGMGGTHGHVILQQGAGRLELNGDGPVTMSPSAAQSVSDGSAQESAATKQDVAAAWSSVLVTWLRKRCNDTSLHESRTFEELALGSVEIAELMAFIESDINQPLSPSVFFDNPTIAQLAEHIVRKSGSAPGFAVQERESPVAENINRFNSNADGLSGGAKPSTPALVPATGPVIPNIAITGMAVRLPQANSLDDFWQLVKNGRVVLKPVKNARPELASSDTNRYAALLDSVRGFDGEFFGLSPRECNLLDPQVRLALQTVYHAIEDANLASTIRGSNTGVFAGISFRDYEHLLRHSGPDKIEAHESTGNAATMLANRISYTFNLKGPSVVVDTACSSSLVAFHQACNALRMGECEQAIVLGASLLLSPWHFEHMESLGALSPSGKCAVFDAAADGYIPGEAIVAVVLQSQSAGHSHPQTHLQNSYAEVIASAVNHAGKTNSITVPGVSQQAALLSHCWSKAGMLPGYIETHGTGTPMGDPIEVDAIARAFSDSTDSAEPCYLGSVKANLGHTEAAAGLTGLIKAVLVTKHGIIPPQAAFTEQNKKIILPSQLKISSTESAWDQLIDQRISGISSFGFGGANAHVLLRGVKNSVSLSTQSPQLCVVSARNRDALMNSIRRLRHWIATHRSEELAGIASALAQREVFAERMAFVANNIDELLRHFDRALTDGFQQSCVGYIDENLDRAASDFVARGTPPEISITRALPAHLPGYGFVEQAYWFSESKTAYSSGPDSATTTAVDATPQLAFYEQNWTRQPLETSECKPDHSLWLCSPDVLKSIEAGALSAGISAQCKLLALESIAEQCAAFAGPIKIVLSANANGNQELQSDGQFKVVKLFQEVLASGHADTELVYIDRHDLPAAESLMMSGFALSASAIKPGVSLCTIFGGLSDAELLSELCSDQGPVSVQYRNGERGFYRPQKISLTDATARIAQNKTSGFKVGGTYVITGGMGKLGQLLARQLVNEYKANIILLGRRPIDGISHDFCRSLSHNANAVVYLQADVTQAESLLGALTFAEQRFGKLDAVLHAAGCLIEGPLMSKSASDFRTTLASKVSGLDNLLSAAKKLKAFPRILAFSSTSAVIPSAQLADYSMANAYMDHRCRACFAQGLPVVAVQLPYWQNGGMQADAATLDLIQAQTGFLPLPDQLGFNALGMAAAQESPVVLIAYGDAEKIHAVLDAAIMRRKRLPIALPSTAASSYAVTSDTANSTDTEQVLLQLVQDVLALKKRPALTTPLADMGFESITVIEFTRRVKTSLGVELSGADIYSYRTLQDYFTFIQSQVVVDPSPSEQVENTAQHQLPFNRVGSESVTRSENQAQEILLVGMAGRFPGAQDLMQFWQNQLAGKDVIQETFPERMVGELQPTITGAGFVSRVDDFDAGFFNQTQVQAEQTDPQQRLLLQSTWHALEDAGVTAESLSGCKVGVFIGISNIEYREVLAAFASHNGHNVSGTSLSMSANSISYFFNWTGPSETVDTGCSSSLVALHRARKALDDGDCDWAVVGGANLLLSKNSFKACEDAGMLSKNQRCYTFDARANGYVRGEGVGVVLLKGKSVTTPTAPAYAALKNTGINHNGKGQSLTAPSAIAQSELLQQVYSKRNLNIDNLDYIECHGTATELGDPIEINGLKLAFDALGQSPTQCALGTVKTHIGHLESAAGIAGLIRTALALHTRQRPANLHFQTLNPHIRLANSPFYIQTECEPWSGAGQRLAGVSSFGFGGVNAHAVLGSVNNTTASVQTNQRLLFVWSAKTEESLRQQIINFKNWLEQQQAPCLASIAFTLANHRSAFTQRAALEAQSVAEILSAINDFEHQRESALAFCKYPAKANGWHQAELAVPWLNGETGARVAFSDNLPVARIPGYAFEQTPCWPQNYRASEQTAPPSFPAPQHTAELPSVAHDLAAVRKKVRDIFIEVTRQPFNDATPDKQFDELAIDSITGLTLVNKLAEYFGPVSKTLLFEHKTIAELTDYFSQRKIADFRPAVSAADLPQSLSANNSDIAIVGMAGQFASADNPEALWQMLSEHGSGIREVPAERFDWRAIFGNPQEDDSKTNCKWGGFVNNVDLFDPAFFGISPKEAEAMDPQQRLFLTACYQTLEEAGYNPSALKGKKGGVFAGVSALDYIHVAERAGRERSMHTASGLAHTVVANRVSYFFGFTGPSEIVDTACSSSLVAIHRAIRALQHNECDFALAGGVNLTLTEELFVAFGQSGFLSPTGRCHSFSDQADGYIRGEGCGVVMLKRRADALKDGDDIRGIIRGSGVNHGGRVRSLSVPNPGAQAELVEQVWREANVSPADISYIEAHGTGTSLGDPIEIEGLKKACEKLAVAASQASIAVGALKANIGHLESAAGVAGLIKILLCMRQQELPAIAGLERLNPYLELENTPLTLLQKNTPWPVPEQGARVAALSSFGFGGTNAHMVVEAPDHVVRDTANSVSVDALADGCWLPLSAHSETELNSYIAILTAFFAVLEKTDWPTLAQCAWVLQTVHDARDTRVLIFAKSVDDFVKHLTEWGGLQQFDQVGVPADLTPWLKGEQDSWPESRVSDKPSHHKALPARPFGGERYWHPEDGSSRGQTTAVGPVANDMVANENWRDVLTRLAEGDIDLDTSNAAIQL